ncbi:hypothetical protein [Flocculibacter collagenilyticus]|uniref:hypothetical protein n=1 Tax=Flocculibacter collagenilyticus TaxID=2744479 RepID=UPI0018F7B956|nr:hypothetical protein [Flocculibacter collagenilyticus]
MKINLLLCVLALIFCSFSSFAEHHIDSSNVKSHIRFWLELEAPATFDSKTLSFLIKLQNISDDVIEFSTLSPPKFNIIIFNQLGLNLSRKIEIDEPSYPKNRPRHRYKLAPKEVIIFRKTIDFEPYKSGFENDTQLFFKAYSAFRLKDAEYLNVITIDSERLFHKNFSTPALVEKFRLRDEKRKQYLLKSQQNESQP